MARTHPVVPNSSWNPGSPYVLVVDVEVRREVYPKNGGSNQEGFHVHQEVLDGMILLFIGFGMFWVKALPRDKGCSFVAHIGQVLLDYEGVSKAHAEVSLREKLPEEVILGSDVKLPTMLSIRDLTSRNGIGIHKKPEDQADQDCIPTIGSFERLQSATSQAQCSNWLVVLRCLSLKRIIGLPSQKGDVSGQALKWSVLGYNYLNLEN